MDAPSWQIPRINRLSNYHIIRHPLNTQNKGH